MVTMVSRSRLWGAVGRRWVCYVNKASHLRGTGSWSATGASWLGREWQTDTPIGRSVSSESHSSSWCSLLQRHTWRPVVPAAELPLRSLHILHKHSIMLVTRHHAAKQYVTRNLPMTVQCEHTLGAATQWMLVKWHRWWLHCRFSHFWSPYRHRDQWV